MPFRLLLEFHHLFHILSARDEETSIVMGLDLGADDYLTKPFRLRELISCMKAVLLKLARLDAGTAAFKSEPVDVRVLIERVLEPLQTNIFSHFCRGSETADSNSVGIGLALAKAIFTAQDGEIAVRSQRGVGTRFVIRLFRGVV